MKKTPDRDTKFLEKAPQKAGTYYHVNVKTPTQSVLVWTKQRTFHQPLKVFAFQIKIDLS